MQTPRMGGYRSKDSRRVLKSPSNRCLIGGMSSDEAIVAAIAILATTFFVMIFILASRRQKAKEEEMKRLASARGWTFETVRERGFRVQRWTGTTEGIAWKAESLMQVSGGGKHSRRQHISRWHGAYSPGINSPIVCMGVKPGAEKPSFSVAQGESWVARLAQKAAGFAFDKAIDAYFGADLGKEVDAAALRRVEGTDTPGYIVMAANKDEGARVLSQGLQRALPGMPHDNTWVLLRPHGISLARMVGFRDVTEVEAFIRAGLSLKHAFTFGRPSPS